jgi:hypothetical protein
VDVDVGVDVDVDVDVNELEGRAPIIFVPTSIAPMTAVG